MLPLCNTLPSKSKNTENPSSKWVKWVKIHVFAKCLYKKQQLSQTNNFHKVYLFMKPKKIRLLTIETNKEG